MEASMCNKGLANDGLPMLEVGALAEQKYELVHKYNCLFATGMKNIWEKRIYVDLFCGPGRVRIEHSGKIVMGSPLLAFEIPDRYDQYIFCDENAENIEALSQRVRAAYPEVKVDYIVGDCNDEADHIVELMPRPTKQNRVLTFCFVDPFSLGINFRTIQTLSGRFTDFLILLALSMDANRNQAIYMEDNNMSRAT
jgi:three-Cys-motif partner protein